MPKVLLKEVVERIKDKVDKDNTHLKYYIGGEHFDYGEVCVTKRALIEGSTIGPAFHMRFMPGDVLLMSRNPHLRKSGVVDFEGLCSDVSYVCRTKNEGILMQSYLPFIFQTDHFWDFAEQNKHGSTNYFLNWTDFEKYEFELPTIEIQKELVKVLWEAQKLKMGYQKMLLATDELVKSQFIEMFGDPITNNYNWEVAPLKEVAPETVANVPKQEEYWWLNLDMIESYSGCLIERVVTKSEDIGNSTAAFDDSMVLYSKLRPYLNKVFVPKEHGFATTELVRLTPDPRRLNKYFLFNLLRGDEFVVYANSISSGAQMPRMPMKELREFSCILPPMELQNEFVAFAEQIDKSKFELKKSIENVSNLIKILMQQDFSN